MPGTAKGKQIMRLITKSRHTACLLAASIDSEVARADVSGGGVVRGLAGVAGAGWW
jgi:hypothetical protein